MQADSLTMQCRNCGERVLPEFAFCEACGQPLQGAPGVADGGSHAAAITQPDPGVQQTCVTVCLCGGRAFDANGYCEACGRRMKTVHATELKALGDFAASASHRGLHHADNQDSVGMLALPGAVALAVADGVSTACHARAAADAACTEALAALRDFSSVEPMERLQLAVKRAHAAVCKLPHDAPGMAEPQATLVVALVEAQQLWFAWVGDSRLYVVDAVQVRQLTVDDSWLNEQLALGMDPQDAEKDENAHCITQCLGMRDADPEVHVGAHQLAAGASVVLCSDGLWNYVQSPGALAELLAAGTAAESLTQRCARLVDYANAAGGHDNITLALYQPMRGS